MCATRETLQTPAIRWIQVFSIRKPLPIATNSLISCPSTAIGSVSHPAIAPQTKAPITTADNVKFWRTTCLFRFASRSP